MKKIFFTVVVSLLSCVSCIDETDEESAVDQAKEQIECVYNSDCPTGLVCGYMSGRCEQCYMDSQCADGQKCSPAGECVAQCKTDRDCASGECVAGKCTGSPVSGGEAQFEAILDGGSTGVDWLDEIISEIEDGGIPDEITGGINSSPWGNDWSDREDSGHSHSDGGH